jgi:hypothetical protein
MILLVDELQALGIALVSLNEGIDATTPLAVSRCTCSRFGHRNPLIDTFLSVSKASSAAADNRSRACSRNRCAP